jgi:hypothetical protein
MFIANPARAHVATTLATVSQLMLVQRVDLVRWHRECEDALAATYNDMIVFCETANMMAVRVAYLVVHKRSPAHTGQMIRWRSLGHKHVLWSDVTPLLQDQPRPVREWYIEVNKQVELINLQERAQRSLVKVGINSLAVLDESQEANLKPSQSKVSNSKPSKSKPLKASPSRGHKAASRHTFN